MASPAKKPAGKAKGPTPMMAQFLELKAQAQGCLLFYRMGDFFELFFDDARAAAATLDIALTSRGEHDGAPVPMCGVPVHAAESYLAKLIRAGHKVAIAEQTETPAEAKARGSKSLVARDIVRFVTAGTLTEENLLDARADNRLMALADVHGEVGIAVCDISTGAFMMMAVDAAALDAEIARLAPSEIIAADGSGFSALAHELRDPRDFGSAAADAALRAHFEVATLDGYGDFTRAELAAAGGLLAYLQHVTKGALPFLQAPVRVQKDAFLLIDAATRESLEIVVGTDGTRRSSLLGNIDRTVTGAGARALANDLAAPLRDTGAIGRRLAAVQWVHADRLLRDNVRETLKSIPDIARALGRVVAGRGSPRDLGQIRDGLNAARALREQLGGRGDLPDIVQEWLPLLGGHSSLIDLLSQALVDTPPTERQSGGYIRTGYDAALDELRATGKNARTAIAALEAKYRAQTGINTLKIKHNAVLGYFIEVPARHGDALMTQDSPFTHRQTLAGAVRFNASDLHEEAVRIAEAGGHALAAEDAHFEDLVDQATARKDAVAHTANVLARIDVAASHAQRAAEGDWCCPEFASEPVLEIEGGRHPVVETALAADGISFVANDCTLAPDSRLWLVSGPNMGGKSTFLRQNALIVLLAQAGGFVPAAHARLGPVDRLFSRVGASDNLARGRSTFMVEMVETAAILAQATEHSFVILDEVGRGTSTYDGLALAWAVVEAVHETNRCRCLFATHYHELTRLAETLDALSLHHVRAREWKGELVLLHELADGPADRSYGIAVAKLAGIAKPVLARAKAVLSKLEAGRAATGGLAAGLDDLPLFAASIAAEEAEAGDTLRDAIADMDVDAMSPRDALEKLYELKKAMREE